MNQSLLQKLKRVRLGDFIHILLFIVALPIAAIAPKKHPDLWLFSDCADEARDNAYWLFKYVAVVCPEQEIVFAINPMSTDYPKVKQIGKVVAFGGFRHWVYYLCASNNISSQKACGPNPAVCYLLERFRMVKGNKIFLQHGIIKDNISFLYYKYTNIRLFTCSVKREYEYVQKYYGYPAGYVQLLGLCRFDQLWNVKVSSKIIVIMPTWRKWLSHPTQGFSRKDLEKNFLLSEFYKKWRDFLYSPEFHDILKKYDFKAVFYLHREAQKYSAYFDSPCPRIRIGTFPKDDVQELLKDSQILITDYSSVAMDYAFMDKPLCYYQFDYTEFRERHLGEGYFNYEADGFGPVCHTMRSLISALEKLLKNQMAEATIYKERRRNFFTLRDNHNCERTLRAIQALNIE